MIINGTKIIVNNEIFTKRRTIKFIIPWYARVCNKFRKYKYINGSFVSAKKCLVMKDQGTMIVSEKFLDYFKNNLIKTDNSINQFWGRNFV